MIASESNKPILEKLVEKRIIKAFVGKNKQKEAILEEIKDDAIVAAEKIQLKQKYMPKNKQKKLPNEKNPTTNLIEKTLSQKKAEQIVGE